MGELVVWREGALAEGTISRLSHRIAMMDVNEDISQRGAALLAPEDAAAIIAEADGALVPCSRDFAVKQAGVMLAVFAGARAEPRAEGDVTRAARDLHLRAIVSALAKAPEAVVEHVVADVVMTHRFGPPLPADITARIEAIVQPIRNARLIAVLHQREQAKRAEARRKREAEEARIEADRPHVQAAFEALSRSIGAAVAAPEEKPRRMSDAQARAAKLSAVDRPAFWRLVDEGVSPEEAATRAEKAEAAE